MSVIIAVFFPSGRGKKSSKEGRGGEVATGNNLQTKSEVAAGDNLQTKSTKQD